MSNNIKILVVVLISLVVLVGGFYAYTKYSSKNQKSQETKSERKTEKAEIQEETIIDTSNVNVVSPKATNTDLDTKQIEAEMEKLDNLNNNSDLNIDQIN